MVRHRLWFAGALSAWAIAPLSSPLQAQEAPCRENCVVVSTGGEYVSYPALKVTVDAAGAREFEIDMTKAGMDRLAADADEAVFMTWATWGSTHTLCFRHRDKHRCRDFALDLDVSAAPRFQPSLNDVWPTIYITFRNSSGEKVVLSYSSATILTYAEDVARLHTYTPRIQ